MLFDYVLQHIPNLGLKALHHLLCIFDIVSGSVGHQLLHHEGLEQLDSHLLGKSALVNLKLGSNHDNGTSGIVHALAQKVLAETSLFTL